MDFIQCKNSSARDIASAFGVPSQLLGIPGDSTYSNLVESRISLWEQTVIPIMEKLIDHLNSWLVPCFGDNLELSYNKDDIEVLAEKREKSWEYIQSSDFITTNEKREAFGLPPIEGGDILNTNNN
jgi:HK97 family phage portal protein